MQTNQNQKNFSEYVFEFQFDTFKVRNKGFQKKFMQLELHIPIVSPNVGCFLFVFALEAVC